MAAFESALDRTRGAWLHAERIFDQAYGPALNPLRHLGALGFLFFWIVVVSGLYLYAVLDTSVDGVYRSIAWLSREQWYLGGVLRSLHRYAADAFLVVTALHMLREFLLGRFRAFRAYSWLTGVPLLWLIYISGNVGFWLRWDRLAQFSAVATAEWLDTLPIFATPLARNFLGVTSVSDRLFSLFVFVHIGVPLLLMFGLWFHIRRISRAEIFPQHALAVASFAALVGLSLVRPVLSDAPADLSVVPATLAPDWFYLVLGPLLYASSAGVVWTLVAAAMLIPLAMPAITGRVARTVAIVEPDHCTGCGLCAHDCPYAAIVMVPRPGGADDRPVAMVTADHCAGCGICAGSCPSATPLLGAAQLVSGIDMAQMSADRLRRALDQALAKLSGEHRIVVFGCDRGADVTRVAGEGVAVLSLSCIGMLRPSFVEYALRGGATGVLVTGCRQGGCEYRLGNRWAEDRLAGVREPRLRRKVSRDALGIVWADRSEAGALFFALDRLRRAATDRAGRASPYTVDPRG